MTVEPGRDRYHVVSIGLHWLMLVLIALVYASMEFRGLFPKGSAERDLMKVLHFSVGISVLILSLVRAGVRLSTVAPAIRPPLPRYLRLATTGMHLALYGFMFVVPLLGWAILSAKGAAIPFFGVALFPIISEDHAFAEQLADLHETFANIGYFLIGAHALAALFHHFIRRDNTLQRMVPHWPTLTASSPPSGAGTKC